MARATKSYLAIDTVPLPERTVRVSYDPRMLFQGLVDGQVPATLAQGSYELEITP